MTDVSKAIDVLLEGVVPERVAELKATWGEQQDRVRLQDGGGFLVHQVYGTVQVNELALKLIWLIGFTAWRAVDAYAGILWALQITHQAFDPSALSSLSGQSEADAAFDLAMSRVRDLSSSQTIADFEWPADVPFPSEDVRLRDRREHAIFDLVCMAGGYIFLHEIRHSQLWRDGLNPEQAVVEETQCDDYAREIMLGKAKEYAEANGYPEDLVRAKRTIGVLFAKLIILTITPKKSWSGSDDHPAVKDRIKGVLRGVSDPVPDWFWSTCAALLAAFARHYGVIDKPIPFASNQELAMALCDKFDAAGAVG